MPELLRDERLRDPVRPLAVPEGPDPDAVRAKLRDLRLRPGQAARRPVAVVVEPGRDSPLRPPCDRLPQDPLDDRDLLAARHELAVTLRRLKAEAARPSVRSSLAGRGGLPLAGALGDLEALLLG